MARAIKCVPDQSKWSSADIEVVRTSPYDNHKSSEHGVELQDRPPRSGDADQQKKRPTGRKVYIKGEDIRAYGYTVGCPRCNHEGRYAPGRTTKGHSEACRARIVAELSKPQKGSDVFKLQRIALIDPLLSKLNVGIRCPQSIMGGGLMR